MSWVKVDDRLWCHRKFAKLSAGAVRLWLFALCWANQQESDGAIPKEALRLFDARRKFIDELVAVGLWEETPSGHVIHDYLDYQPSASRRKADRDSVAGRVRAYRAKSDRTPIEVCSNSDPTVSSEPSKNIVSPPSVHEGHQAVAKDVTLLHARLKRESNAAPVPARPVQIQIQSGEQQPKDLTASARVEPPAPESSSKIPCPSNLALTSEQRAALSMHVPDWAIDELTMRFVSKSVASQGDRRPLEAWLKCCSMAVTGWWNNPSQRPHKPTPDGRVLTTAEQASQRRLDRIRELERREAEQEDRLPALLGGAI